MITLSRFTSLSVLLAAGALVAQDTSGTVTGTVTAKGGKPVASATVRLASPALLGERVVTTDAQGRYRVPLLLNGHYTVTASAPGYMTTKGTFQVLAGQIARQDVVLTATAEVEKAASAVVEVVADAAQVDKTATVTQTNYAMETLQKVTTGSIDSILGLSPGTVGGTGSGSENGLKIRGGSAFGSKVTLNGVTITEEGGGYMVDNPAIKDMVESMAVIQSPLNARYGNTDGGVISLITTKGSNTFAGTVRAYLNNALWRGDYTPYPQRDGVTRGTATPSGDSLGRTYDVTIRGPLWKDHVTFAYGSTLTPTSYYSAPFKRLINDPATPNDAAGTFFRDPATGAVIRKAETFAQGKPNFDVEKNSFHQFVVFAQLGSNHQLEWNYSQMDYAYQSPYYTLDGTMRGTDGQVGRIWNLAYKGIVSDNSVLEARYAHTFRAFPHPYSPGSAPIQLKYFPTVIPREDGTYVANSLLQGYDAGSDIADTHGFNADKGDTFDNDSVMVNYQHLLNVAGMHQIDLGYQREKFQWNTQANGAATSYYVPGMIARNLRAGDITLPGGGTVDPSLYAGKYLVFSYKALQSQLDPSFGADPMLYSAYQGLIPTMIRLTGAEDGSYRMVTDSFYLNDLWTINERHSVMAGVRVDLFKVNDTTHTISSYTQPTLRLEYKYDLAGDQSRLVNVSAAQFHARPAGSLFYPMVRGRLANLSTLYWAKGDGTPMLVDEAELTNAANWKALSPTQFGGTTFTTDAAWRAPITQEVTAGFRRGYTNGGFWRATLVQRTWKNLYDFFAGDVFTDENGAASLRRVMKNDASAHRTYRSAELEWALPFGKQVQFGGSYTYARLVSNARPTMDHPDRSQYQSMNWNAYLGSLQGGAGTFNPDQLQDAEHVMKCFLTADLTSGKVKSSATLRAIYQSGSPELRSVTYRVDAPKVPGYYDGTGDAPGDLPYSLTRTLATATGSDQLNLVFQYNLEMPIYRSMAWFTTVTVSNPLNTRAYWSGGPGGSPYQDRLDKAQRNAYGWRATTNLNGYGTGHLGTRSFNVETGLRF